MHDSFEERLQSAMQFRQNDDLPQACALFAQSLKEQPENKVVLGMLAACYFESEQYELAANYAKQSVAVSPTSELSSWILFHSLWQLEQCDAAFDEIRRFTTLAPSAAYDELLQDINKTSF